MTNPLSSKPRLYAIQLGAGLLRLDQVLVLLAIGKTQLYAMVASGDFPRGIRLGQRCVRWHAGDVHAWIDAKRGEK